MLTVSSGPAFDTSKIHKVMSTREFEAVQYTGLNQSEVIEIARGRVQFDGTKGKIGVGAAIDEGDWLVRDGDNVLVVDRESFQRLYVRPQQLSHNTGGGSEVR